MTFSEEKKGLRVITAEKSLGRYIFTRKELHPKERIGAGEETRNNNNNNNKEVAKCNWICIVMVISKLNVDCLKELEEKHNKIARTLGICTHGDSGWCDVAVPHPWVPGHVIIILKNNKQTYK